MTEVLMHVENQPEGEGAAYSAPRAEVVLLACGDIVTESTTLPDDNL